MHASQLKRTKCLSHRTLLWRKVAERNDTHSSCPTYSSFKLYGF